MKRGYILTIAKLHIFFETEKRRNDATICAIIDKLGELHKLNPELIQRAKTDRATLDDLKKRLHPCTLNEAGERLQFFSGNNLMIDYHKTSPEIIIFSL